GDLVPNSTLGMEIYPVPVKKQATVKYKLAKSSPVKLEIYDTMGGKLRDLFDGYQRSGSHQLSFSASLASGIYIVRLVSNQGILSKSISVK
ncbi:MAG TPA: T9SS type A sorting domain-containing protein, partial [Sunxiuqinia sp.]|nr:T9SS type A sorting domain-containing protein [Sunxiuqinia sp.]